MSSMLFDLARNERKSQKEKSLSRCVMENATGDGTVVGQKCGSDAFPLDVTFRPPEKNLNGTDANQ